MSPYYCGGWAIHSETGRLLRVHPRFPILLTSSTLATNACPPWWFSLDVWSGICSAECQGSVWTERATQSECNLLLVQCTLKAAPGLMPRDQVEDNKRREDECIRPRSRGSEGWGSAAGQRRSVLRLMGAVGMVVWANTGSWDREMIYDCDFVITSWNNRNWKRKDYNR